jgi:hypothetical protein
MSQEKEKNLEIIPSNLKKGESPVLTEDVVNVAESIGEAIDLESLDVLAMGNVSENVKKVSEQGASTGSSSAKNVKNSISSTKSRIPSPKVMKRDVENKIKEEIDLLSKRANTLIKKAHKPGNQFELVVIMRKLRKLRQLLNNIFKFSGEQIKNLWFRFVKDRK